MKSKRIAVYSSKLIGQGSNEERVKAELIKTLTLDNSINEDQALDLESDVAFCLKYGFKVNQVYINLI